MLAQEAKTAATGLLETMPPSEMSRSGNGPVESATWCLAAAQLSLQDPNENLATTREFLQGISTTEDMDILLQKAVM